MKQQLEGTTVPHSKEEEGGKEKKQCLVCGGQGLSKGKVWVVGGAYA